MTKLINFRVNESTQKRFDLACRASGRTRTQVLIYLMDNFVLENGYRLKTRNNLLNEASVLLSDVSSDKSALNCNDYERVPLSIFFSDGQENCDEENVIF